MRSQTIYSRTFGNPQENPVIFLHGGPGYNCANFEATTAQALAEKGFYVIVYDRRAEGRSEDTKAQFTFRETFDDLNLLYQKYGLSKATLIGHSFGGIVAALFAEDHPEKVQSVILVSAPVSLQATFKTILTKSKSLYLAKSDSLNLHYISMLENMDTTSIQYSSYCFGHALQNGFYSPKAATDEAKKIYLTFKTDTVLTKYAMNMTYEAPYGFWTNEKYTTIDLTDNLSAVQKLGVEIFGLYGVDDGLYSTSQVSDLQTILGQNNLKYLENCSHNVFIDQQAQFLGTVMEWGK